MNVYGSHSEMQPATRRAHQRIEEIVRDSLAGGRKRLTILYVCSSNVNRSADMHLATLDFVLRRGLDGHVVITSGGTARLENEQIALPVIDDFSGYMRFIARKRGLDERAIDAFEGCNLLERETAGVRDADLIIVATRHHKDILVQNFDNVAERTFLFNELLPVNHQDFAADLPDKKMFAHIETVLRIGLFPLIERYVEKDENSSTVR